jgi:hypothetical protein
MSQPIRNENPTRISSPLDVPIQSPAASSPQSLGSVDLLLNLWQRNDQPSSPAESSGLPPDGALYNNLDAESLPADLCAFDGELHDALANAAELEQPADCSLMLFWLLHCHHCQ